MAQSLRLEIIDPRRGFPRPSPEGTERIAWAPFESACTVVEHALLRELGEHRVEHLHAPIDALKELTLHLVVTRSDFSRYALRGITVTDGIVTERWRRILGSYWGVPIEAPPILNSDLSGLLEDTLDNFPSVARPLTLFERFHGYDDPTVGSPAFELTDQRLIVRVAFEPALFPDAGARLARDIHQAIASRHPDGSRLRVELTTALLRSEHS